jgi:hypothetical protein
MNSSFSEEESTSLIDTLPFNHSISPPGRLVIPDPQPRLIKEGWLLKRGTFVYLP